jgi:2-amino-4-hydroxy-6-hydroxymethyldihydropteridine diphosphokinase
MICYLGLGSNLGDRKDYLNRAISRLVTNSDIEMLKCSTIIETEAFGKTDQPDFLNCVIKIKTTLNPADLLKLCAKTEKGLGRVRYEKWGPRTIDIDVLLYGNLVIDETELTIPHSGIPEREFILISLNELSPDYIHPVLGKRIAELYNDIVVK